jgi:hypothetical protein
MTEILILAASVAGLAWTAIVATKDMNSRGKPGAIYGALVLVVPPVGIPAWLIVRSMTSTPRAR